MCSSKFPSLPNFDLYYIRSFKLSSKIRKIFKINTSQIIIRNSFNTREERGHFKLIVYKFSFNWFTTFGINQGVGYNLVSGSHTDGGK